MAGVSTQTVSRVINERPDVSRETRKHVQDVIEKLGYRPSALARSLIRRRSHTLGVVTAGLNYIGPSRTLNGITAAAEEAGYALLLKELPRFDANDNEPIFQALVSRHVDGIIWAVQEVGENWSWMNKLALDYGIPIVHLTMEPRENISVVSINNYLGGCMAMSHLLDQGYRHIGHISGPLDWWEARQRMKAWKDALEKRALDFMIILGWKEIGRRQAALVRLKNFLSNTLIWIQSLLPMIRWHLVQCKLSIKRGCGFLKISGLWDLITFQNLLFSGLPSRP